MSLVPLLPHAVSPAVFAVGFAILLVLSLVAVEEAELRRAAPPAPADD